MVYLNLELMQEQNKVAFPNYSGSFEKTLLQDFQKVAELLIQKRVIGLLPYLSLIIPIKGEAVNCANW